MLLTPKQSLALRLYFRNGMKQREIAAKMGVTQVAVSQMISRGRQELRRRGLMPDQMNLEQLHDLVVLTGLRDE